MTFKSNIYPQRLVAFQVYIGAKF